ncbi:MAG TPA: hypothetical protein VNZ86_07725 [Bacteroidia bacterium]|nr:hypothetical protein [Bacteroidia bacterium]
MQKNRVMGINGLGVAPDSSAILDLNTYNTGNSAGAGQQSR